MSSEALTWAFAQDVKPSALKFTLVALCECANYQTRLIYPSNAHLVSMTGQDRKTLIANIAKLEAMGLIVDTGERVGKTKQVKVYRTGEKSAQETLPKTGQLNTPKNGTVDDVKGPVFPDIEAAKGPVFPAKESQKRDTEPSMEPSFQLSDDNCLDVREGDATPPTDKPKARKSKSAPSMPIPDGWSPEQFSNGTTCRDIVDGWPPGRLKFQIERFCANHQSRGSQFANWQMAWKTWVLNSVEYGKNNGKRFGNSAADPNEIRNPMVRAGLERERRFQAGRT